MNVLDAATVAIVLSVACSLLVCGLAFWMVCAVSGKRDMTLVEPDPTPFEDEPLWHDGSGGGQDWDPSPTLREETIPVPDDMVMFRGGLVHTACLTRWLRGGMLTDGCAVHLTDDVQAGAS